MSGTEGGRRRDAPDPPYWAVIFSSQRTDADQAGYEAMSARMKELVQRQPGFLGFDTARGADGFGITVAYFESLEAIAAWRANAEHRAAQNLGRERWYNSYRLRVAKVERESSFP